VLRAERRVPGRKAGTDRRITVGTTVTEGIPEGFRSDRRGRGAARGDGAWRHSFTCPLLREVWERSTKVSLSSPEGFRSDRRGRGAARGDGARRTRSPVLCSGRSGSEVRRYPRFPLLWGLARPLASLYPLDGGHHHTCMSIGAWKGTIMNRLAGTLAPAHATNIGSGARESRRGTSSPLLLVCLVRVVSLVFSVCVALWSIWFLWFADRHAPDKRYKSEGHTGLSSLFRSANQTDSVE
jgi:hypothetical protein